MTTIDPTWSKTSKKTTQTVENMSEKPCDIVLPASPTKEVVYLSAKVYPSYQFGIHKSDSHRKLLKIK